MQGEKTRPLQGGERIIFWETVFRKVDGIWGCGDEVGLDV